MAAEPPILAAKPREASGEAARFQSGSFPFSSRLRRPYSLSTVKILPHTRTIPPATQAMSCGWLLDYAWVSCEQRQIWQGLSQVTRCGPKKPPKQTNMAAGSAGRTGSSSGRFRNTLRQKSRDYKESSDSEDDELFDGEKLKTRLMSMWNNMRHGL